VAPSEDALITQGLGLPDEAHRAQIRGLLHANSPPPRRLLEEAAAALGVELEVMLEYEGRPVRAFYVEPQTLSLLMFLLLKPPAKSSAWSFAPYTSLAA
jgi:hypothetical protein